MIMPRCILLFLFFISAVGCSDTENPSTIKSNSSNVPSGAEVSHPSTATTVIPTPIEYEILREPNGGSGVFDFMYIVYVSGKLTNGQAQWIFEDIMKRKGGSKIAIDVWNSKKAFYEVLKVYEKEDQIYNAGGNLKAFAKERDKVTSKYDKYNIAQYTNNGSDISVKYPNE